MKKILGICGDSFLAAEHESKIDSTYGKNFTEILGNLLNCEVVTFARGGVSNCCIRLQMDEIVKFNPTYVIVTTTTIDRVEIPVQKSNTKNFEKYHGIYNIDYSHPNNQSYFQHEKFKNFQPSLYSLTFSNLISNYQNGDKMKINDEENFSEKISKLILDYYENLYDASWKNTLDTWVISEGVQKFIRDKINFSLILASLDDNHFNYCKDYIIPHKDKLNPWTYYRPEVIEKNPFHISDEDSEILANFWYEKIKIYF